MIAYDYTDEQALDRRLAAREAHLEGLKKMYEEGTLINGGAILDESGKMIGSTVYFDFPSREALDECIQADPYVTGKVWEKIDVQPVKLVPFGEK